MRAANQRLVSPFSRLHQAASQGKPPLGFLNPALYAAGAIGFDVTQGNNKLGACPAGFPATKGWDAITGLGTPTYQALRAALLG